MDLNLLKLFRYLWYERSSTKAAQRLHITQSAVSQALGRLRHDFNDEMFVRVPHGLTPTPLAEELAPKILKILDEISSLSGFSDEFSPASMNKVFNVALTDYTEIFIMPRLIKSLQDQAPQVKVRCQLLKGVLPKEGMQMGAIDCAIAGFFKNVPEDFYQRELFKDRFTGLCRPKHPFLESSRGLEDYCQYPHLMASVNGDFIGIIDKLLPTEFKRSVSYVSESFLSLPAIIKETNSLLALPGRLAEHHARVHQLKCFTLPLNVPEISIKAVWHKRVHQDAFHKWIRNLI